MSTYYYNDQHSEVPATRISTYNSLSAAQGVIPTTSSRINPLHYLEVVPQLPYPLNTTRNKSTTSGGGYQGVSFDCVHPGYTTQGIPLDGLTGSPYNPLSHLVNPEDRVGTLLLSRAEGPHVPPRDHVILKICWPGCDSLFPKEYKISTTEYGHPITRAQLGSQISMHYRRVFTQAPLHGSQDPQWAFGPNGIKFDSLLLLSFHHVDQGFWMAEVGVDQRRP